MKLASGKLMDLKNPQLSDFTLLDIATALSKQCRYNGHCARFYSVAEHSWLAAHFARADNLNDDLIKAILLHDAAEAYLGDVVLPLKQMLPDYIAIENKYMNLISQRFDVDFDSWSDLIHAYDLRMYNIEIAELWSLEPNILEHWSPEIACDRFIEFAYEMGVT